MPAESGMRFMKALLPGLRFDRRKCCGKDRGMSKLTIKELQELKGKRQITCTTAHDYFTACACQQAGIDMFVTSGEFIRQYIAGDFTKTTETMTDLLTALEGVRKGAPDCFIYASIPHGAGNISDEKAIEASMCALNHGADAIYYSGMSLERIRACSRQKIPVIGHAGMIPWFASWLGGFHAVGKTGAEAYRVYQDALAMQEAGCIAIELECVPHEVAKEITKRLDILVISMGSGHDCDGDYMFSHDMLGMHTNRYPRHSVRYRNLYEQACEGLKEFAEDVKTGTIADKQKLINISPEELDQLKDLLNR